MLGCVSQEHVIIVNATKVKMMYNFICLVIVVSKLTITTEKMKIITNLYSKKKGQKNKLFEEKKKLKYHIVFVQYFFDFNAH